MTRTTPPVESLSEIQEQESSTLEIDRLTAGTLRESALEEVRPPDSDLMDIVAMVGPSDEPDVSAGDKWASDYEQKFKDAIDIYEVAQNARAASNHKVAGKEYAAALKEFEKILAALPDGVEISSHEFGRKLLYQLGVTHINLARTEGTTAEKATEHLNSAVKFLDSLHKNQEGPGLSKDERISASVNLAAAYQRLDKHDDALQVLGDIRKQLGADFFKHPEAVFILTSTAAIYLEQKEYGKAAAVLAELAEKFPTDKKVQTFRREAADAYYQAGDFKNASFWYEKSFGSAELSEKAEIAHWLRQSLVKSGQPEKAIEILDTLSKGVENDDLKKSLLVERAYALSNIEGKALEGAAALKTFAVDNPTHSAAPTALFEATQIAYTAKNYELSEEYAKVYIKQYAESKDPEILSQIREMQFVLAESYLLTDNKAKAIETYAALLKQENISQDERVGRWRIRHAYALYLNGDHTKAIEQLGLNKDLTKEQQVLLQNHTSDQHLGAYVLASAHYQLGDKHRQAKDYAKAVEHYTASLTVIGTDEFAAYQKTRTSTIPLAQYAHFNRGVSSFQLGGEHSAAARKDFEAALAIDGNKKIAELAPRYAAQATTNEAMHLASQNKPDWNSIVTLIDPVIKNYASESFVQDAFFVRGQAHQSLGNTDKAIADYREAAKKISRSVPIAARADLEIGNLLIEQGKTDDAVTQLNRLRFRTEYIKSTDPQVKKIVARATELVEEIEKKKE